MEKFKVIVSDPPWDHKTWSSQGRHKSPENHYPVCDLDWICGLPVQGVAAKDCVLLLWTTWPHLASGQAHKVIEAWGFQGKSGFPWVKLSKSGKPKMATGYHVRGCTEPLLIATCGKPSAPEPSKRQLGIIQALTGRHSAKPERQYEMAEAYETGPCLEMFARDNGQLPREGWTHLGNELSGRSMEVDLIDLAQGKPIPGLRREDEFMCKQLSISG